MEDFSGSLDLLGDKAFSTSLNDAEEKEICGSALELHPLLGNHLKSAQLTCQSDLGPAHNPPGNLEIYMLR